MPEKWEQRFLFLFFFSNLFHSNEEKVKWISTVIFVYCVCPVLERLEFAFCRVAIERRNDAQHTQKHT